MAVAIAWLPGPAGTRRRVAKLSVEEPDAAEPARPDLWGARVSNDPGLPDLKPCRNPCVVDDSEPFVLGSGAPRRSRARPRPDVLFGGSAVSGRDPQISYRRVRCAGFETTRPRRGRCASTTRSCGVQTEFSEHRTPDRRRTRVAADHGQQSASAAPGPQAAADTQGGG